MLRFVAWLCSVACTLSIAVADPVRDPFADRTGGAPSTGACPPATTIVRTTPTLPSGVKLFALAGSVLWAASFGVGVYARSEYDAARSSFDAAKANHEVALARYGGTGLFAGGALAFGIAGYLYFKGDITERRTAVTPSVSPDHVGVAISGGF